MESSLSNQFSWTEPFAFARARASSSPSGSRVRLAAVLFVIVCIPMLISLPPKTFLDVAVAAGIALSIALLIAYPVVWLSVRIPQKILINSKTFVVASDEIHILSIKWALVGDTVIAGKTYPVICFRTTYDQEHICGLGKNIDPGSLSLFLKQVGVPEPRT